MKKRALIIIPLCIAVLFSACSINTASDFVETETKSPATELITTEPTTVVEDGTGNDAGTFPMDMTKYPAEYLTTKVENSNDIEDVKYTHNGKTKNARVYLPPNYDESKKYNVVYLLGGGKSNEYAFFEKDDKGNYQFKNLMDNLIVKNELTPTIVVSLAFYPDNNRVVNDNNIEFLLDNFADEIKTAIIPAIEGKYSTYLKSTDDQAIKLSRKHRAFGGFSQGSTTTWVMISKCIEYFYYFMPLSGGNFNEYVKSYTADTPQQVRDALNKTGVKPNEFFVYSAVGEIDYTNEEMNRQIKRLKKSDDIFKFTDTDKSSGNITFKVMPDYHHEYSSGFCYACNAMNAFWK